jgi:hypothetical protein
VKRCTPARKDFGRLDGLASGMADDLAAPGGDNATGVNDGSDADNKCCNAEKQNFDEPLD